jgi:hypothetical protein
MFLNAPDYLFVSTNVAKKFPRLMESILVQAYVNHLPGELAKTWQEGYHSMVRIQRRRTLRNTTSLMLMLQYIGTAPFILHRMFIRFVQPFFFSALVILWTLIVTSPIYISVMSVVFAAVVAYVAYSVYYSRAVPPVEPHLVVPALPSGAGASSSAHGDSSEQPPGSLHLPLPTASMQAFSPVSSRQSSGRVHPANAGYSAVKGGDLVEEFVPHPAEGDEGRRAEANRGRESAAEIGHGSAEGPPSLAMADGSEKLHHAATGCTDGKLQPQLGANPARGTEPSAAGRAPIYTEDSVESVVFSDASSDL